MARQLSGFRAWMWQRASALYIALFLLYFLVRMVLDAPPDQLAWKDWLADTPVWIASGLFFLALLVHAWIGVRDVILDYVKPPVLRLTALALVLLFLLANGLWLASILMSVK